MPDVVASRQNQQNQHKQTVKTEQAETNGEEGEIIFNNGYTFYLDLRESIMHLRLILVHLIKNW